MPLHGHGATTFPMVTPGDPGKFTVSKIDFFMAGYWELKLDLQPTSGTADKAHVRDLRPAMTVRRRRAIRIASTSTG